MQNLTTGALEHLAYQAPTQSPADRAARMGALRESIARRALATIGTPAGARILRVVRTGTVLTVATEQLDGYFRYCVDSFRLPTPAETDPDQVDPYTPGEWILADQYGDHVEGQIDGMMADAIAYVAVLRKAAVTA